MARRGGAPPIKDKHELTFEWREVCEEWLADPDRDKAKAYAKVYDRDGKERKTASMSQCASKLFRRKEVQAYLNMRLEKMMKKYLVSQENIVEEWGYLCFSDPRRLFNEDGSLRLPEQWDDAISASISSVKISNGRNSEGKLETLKEIRFWDKNKALADSARHLDMFQKDNESSAPKVVPQRLDIARNRAENKRAKLKLVTDNS